jgi:hypothetical protein
VAEPRDTSMSKILDNVEQELHGVPASAPTPPSRASTSAVEAFAPQKYRNTQDSLQQIQQDFRKVVAELEQRFKALADELKRITG